MQRVLTLCVMVCVATTAWADDFWARWGDGKAELDGYALVEPRYGEPRAGKAVMIFVTEDFSDTLRVKADPGKHPPSDVFPVLKLNFVRDFQTGIYDYNTMTSTFARTEPDATGARWSLAKVSFASEEWCGNVYMQWIPRDGRLHGTSHSYFDGEADASPELPLPPGGVVEDELPILVRGLRGEWLAPGASKTVPFLRSLLRTRLQHVAPAWGEATVARAAAPVTVKTALGTLRASVYTIVEKSGGEKSGADKGDTITFTVEEAAPHRILAWSSSSGESGKITGSARLPYWTMHQNGGEAALKQLGLPPQSKPAPPK